MSMRKIKTFFMGLFVAFTGFFGVMFFIISLNQKSPDKVEKPDQRQVAFKVEKIKKQPVAPKKKKNKKKIKKAGKWRRDKLKHQWSIFLHTLARNKGFCNK